MWTRAMVSVKWRVVAFFFQAEDGIRDFHVWSSDVCSSDLIDPESLGRGLDRLLVARGEGAQGMLHPVAELPGDFLGNVNRVLRDEIDADALGADQPHHLLDRKSVV